MIAIASSVVRPVSMRRLWPIWRPCAVDVWRSAAVAIALLTLLGWSSGHYWMTTWGGRTEMVPNLAVCVILLAIAAASRANRRVLDSLTFATDGFALAAGLLAVMIILHLDVGADLFIFDYAPRIGSGVVAPGRISDGSAYAIALLAIGTIAPMWLRRLCGGLAILAIAVGHLGWLFDGQTSVPTLAALALLALASMRDRRHV